MAQGGLLSGKTFCGEFTTGGRMISGLVALFAQFSELKRIAPLEIRGLLDFALLATLVVTVIHLLQTRKAAE
jgi:hypothetical protein